MIENKNYDEQYYTGGRISSSFRYCDVCVRCSYQKKGVNEILCISLEGEHSMHYEDEVFSTTTYVLFLTTTVMISAILISTSKSFFFYFPLCFLQHR